MGKPGLPVYVLDYLQRLHEIHATKRQTPELSYRGALENLLNAIGRELDPAVQATGELMDAGAGRPDFGFFEIKSGNARGGVEVKSPELDVPITADGSQVSRYVKQYGYVLVTNYRDFLLVVSNENGKPIVEGRCTLAADAEAFWLLKPNALFKLKGEELADFLVGVIKRSAPITRPADLADDLARHAREAKRRLERQDITALAPLKEAMEKALGLHFTGKEGEDFFRSSLVQTLFYGLFSGWMLWREGKHKHATFDWKDASEYLALPLIGDLYEEIARPKKLADLHLREPLDWSTASLNRVDESAFFKRFDQDHAITLFYEPFLKAFDPELRKQLGVWYTPNEIVQYMVGRVDQLLRTELGIVDGLADENVYVLDPCCGTGSYLLEVARKIHQTLLDQGHGQIAALETKKALTRRVFGFEILPAPYVVSHLQLGVLLRQMGTKLSPTQRAGVYLTNALTGWEPPKGAKQTLAFSFLEAEQEAATKVKREAPILVILGNPPYNGYAGVAEDEEAGLMKPYYDGLNEYGVQVRGLNDLYIRFYRLAEQRIAEVGTRGIVCFISNYSWLDGQSHPVMRDRLLRHFERIWIDNCNGDKYRTGKRTPDGKPDQSMFTTDSQSVGIQVGTAVATFVNRGRNDPSQHVAEVYYRDLWGFASDKRAQLVGSLAELNEAKRYRSIVPTKGLRYILTPGIASSDYCQWPCLPDLFSQYFVGVKTSRDDLVVDIDRDRLIERMRRYFDPSVPDEDIRDEAPSAMTEGNRFRAAETRRLLGRRGMLTDKIVPFSYRPLDDRWLYWEPEGKLLDEKRTEYFGQVSERNIAFTAAAAIRKGQVEGPLPLKNLGCIHLIERTANVFMLLHRVGEGLHADRTEPAFNSQVLEAVAASAATAVIESDNHTYTAAAEKIAESLFYHLLAILWSPAYRKENEAALRQDWPRVPIPADAALLEASAKLGRTVADLLLPDKPVPGVTTGKLRDELKRLAIPSKLGGGPIEEPIDTKVNAGWGFRGQKNAVMCGKGMFTKNKDHDGALDIWINDRVYWSNVPADVWTMTIGGYPVVKKWLSYREYKVLGRALKSEELTYITEVVRRLKALLVLAGELDANYRKAAAARSLPLTRK